jgi:hypothetical protein
MEPEPTDGLASPATTDWLTIVVLYYDNPKMLEYQMKYWSRYAEYLSFCPTISVIDDGSQRVPAQRCRDWRADQRHGAPPRLAKTLHERARPPGFGFEPPVPPAAEDRSAYDRRP